jgi:hypothetical protein
VDETGGGVPIPHLGGNLSLIRNEECPRQRGVISESVVDRSRSPRSDARQEAARGRVTGATTSLVLGWRAGYRDDDCRRENEKQRDMFVPPANQGERQQHRSDSDGNPGRPAKSHKQAADDS